MNNLIIIVIIILNIFLKYVLGFINKIIIILVINTISVYVFLTNCKKTQYFGFKKKEKKVDFKSKYWSFSRVLLMKLYCKHLNLPYLRLMLYIIYINTNPSSPPTTSPQSASSPSYA